MSKQRLILAATGVALVVGFFLPWLDISGVRGTVSGWEMVNTSGLDWFTRIALFLCPLAGFMLTLAALGKSKSASSIALAAGGGVLGYTFYKLAWGFVKVTGVGLWLVLAAAVVALVLGLASRSKSA